MKVSADPALSAPVPSGRSGRPAADDGAETGFDHILRNAGKEPPAKGRQAAESRQPLWPDFAARLADKTTDAKLADQSTETNAMRDDAGELSDDDPQTGESKAKRNDKHQPQAHGLPPLPSALPGLPRNVTADTDGTDAETALAAVQPDPDGTAKLAAAEAKLPTPDRAASTAAVPLPAIKGTAETASAASPNGTKAAIFPSGKTAEMESLLPSISAQVAGAGEDIAQQPVPAPDPATAGKKPETGIEAPSVKHPAAADRQQAAPAAPITVTGAQSFPAPAPHPASQTITGLAGAIAADNGARQVLSASAGIVQPAPSVALSSHTLKIELHPAELGMVTASLRLAGGQLSIELKPENHEAHRKLSSDTDSLVKSLQGMGFNVDKITVLQPAIAVNATPRTDAANPTGRDPSSFQPGNSGGNGGASGGQQSGRNQGNDSQHGGQNVPRPRERTGGDLFI